MALEDRVRHLISENSRALTALIDGLHAELHALATKVAGLEQQLADLTSQAPSPGPAPSRTTSRRKTAEG